MLGKKFRELRKSQHKSINEVAKGITSFSSLRRWENGEGEMSVNKVMQLLDRLHIQAIELMNNSVNLDIYTDGVNEAVKDNDIDTLSKLAHKLLKLYHEAPSNEKLFFQAAIACNFYLDFTDKKLMKKEDLMRLKSYFSKIEDWTQENVLLFANTQLLLAPQDIYTVSRSLISDLTFWNKNYNFKYLSINALLNATVCLLKKKAFNEARFVFKQLKTFKLSDKYLDEKVRINYFETVCDYLDTKSTYKMDIFLSGLDAIGLNYKREEFELGFSQFKKLISGK